MKECEHQWTNYGTLKVGDNPSIEIEACVRCGVQRKKASEQPKMIDEVHQVRGFDVEVRREDQRIGAPFLPHGKTQSILRLFNSLVGTRIKRVSCFASSGSDWALNAAIAAQSTRMPFTIFSQKQRAELPAFLIKARDDYGAELEFVRINHTAIMISQARAEALLRGDFFIPFGFELPICMDELTERLRGFGRVETIVLCAGSGITLTCLLKAALLDQKRFSDVIAVSSGRPLTAIRKTVSRHISELEIASVCDALHIEEGGKYGKPLIEALGFDAYTPWPVHPFYERKAFDWLVANIAQLKEPIAFLNM
jgi:hypothetical protein